MPLLKDIGRALVGDELDRSHANLESLRDELGQSLANQGHLQEALTELELSLEDRGWLRLTGDDKEFDRRQLGDIWRLCLLNYLKNPLINRAVNIQSYYVWGQGINIKAKSEPINAVVQQFMDAPRNQSELTSHQARTLKEADLQVYGNLFLVLFTDRVTGQVTVRSIPCDEITDIISNPEDRRDIWLYKREWNQSNFSMEQGTIGQSRRTAYYPDWRYAPKSKPGEIGGNQVMWTSPVYHVKVGGLTDMKFGIPEIYQALDWAKAYKTFLEDRATLYRALSRFAARVTGITSTAGVTAAKAKLGTTLGTGAETNPPPVTGSVFLGKDDLSWEPVRTAGAVTPAEEGRRFLLMVCAATGLPESFFGDVSVGTLATAKSLDRPTELKFVDRRTLWADVFHDIFDFAIDAAYSAIKSELPTVDPETGEEIDKHITIDFPPILEHDVESSVKAIVAAATLSGAPSAGTIPDMKVLSQMLLTALGQQDVDEVIKELFPEEEGKEGRTEAFTEALRELKAAVEKIINNGNGN